MISYIYKYFLLIIVIVSMSIAIDVSSIPKINQSTGSDYWIQEIMPFRSGECMYLLIRLKNSLKIVHFGDCNNQKHNNR